MASRITRFLLGRQPYSSDTEMKQALLLGQLALLSLFICLVYLIADPISGLYSFVIWYALGVIVSLAVVFINRAGYYTIAASILMLISVLILFAIAYVGDQGRGVYFYFVSASMVSLVFFYNRSIPLGLAFIVLFLIAATLAHYMHIPNRENLQASPEALQFRYILNMVVATVSGVIAILFMIWRNNISEGSLLASNKQLEEMTESLAKSKTRFERALLGTKAGIYEWDIANDDIFISNRWKELLGYNPEEVLNMDMNKLMKIVHPEDIKKTSSSINNSISKGENYQNELRMRMKDGAYRWFLDSGIVIHENKKPLIAVGSIIDIDNRKRTEAELVSKNEDLQKANDELDRFVYSASHDMRAPLSTLLGLIEVLKITGEPKDYAHYFEMMISRIKDMEGFIAEVTDYSRNTRLTVNKKPVKLFNLVNNLKESFTTLANKDKVSINIEIDEDLVVTTDETRLKVILNNLMANAIKYNNADNQRFVRIAAKSQNDLFVIEVQDNGRGIAKEFQPNIFDMFFRASEDSSGSGLGLYIVKETLDKLGGEISFNSELRAGTTFTVTIPQNS